MDWLKLNTNGILRGSLSQSKDIVQLTWIKLLALMSETHLRNGRFEYAADKPYSLDFIAINCGITKEILEGCLLEYEEDINPDNGLPRIQHDTNGTIIIVNWDKYQAIPDDKKKLSGRELELVKRTQLNKLATEFPIEAANVPEVRIILEAEVDDKNTTKRKS